MRTGIMEVGNSMAMRDVKLRGLIDGDINGREVTVLKGASIQGDVGARSIVIHGEVHGVVKASSIKVSSTALIVGELRYVTLSIDPGARIEARCVPVH